MPGPGGRSEAWAERPRGTHVALVLAALAFSLLAHVELLRRMPPLPIGRPAAFQPEVRLPAVRLGEVIRAETAPVPRAARFRPSDPARAVEWPSDAEQFREALEQVAAPPAGPPVAAGVAAAASPDAAPERRPWEPRQDLLQIDRALAADEISARPRRYAAPAPRVPRAPDVVLPADSVELAAQLAAATAGGPGAAWPEVPAPAAAAPRPVVHAAVSPPAAPPAAPREESRLLDEQPAEITPVRPVEQSLFLEMYTYTPGDEPGTTYFQMQIRVRRDDVLPVLPRDLLFILDHSESMTTRKVAFFQEALQAWLGQLRPGDRFGVMGFSAAPVLWHKGWTEAAPAAVREAGAFVTGFRAEGKTDISASLRQVLEFPAGPARPMVAVLLTDGRPTIGMVDSAELIESFTRRNQGRISVFAVGAGQRVNRFLVDFLSYKNRGDSYLVPEDVDILAGTQDLARQIGRPVLMNLAYQFTALPGAEVYPVTLTHLYLDRPLRVHGRVPGPLGRTAVRIVGDAGAERRDMVFTLDGAAARAGDEELRREWARHRIYHLVGEYLRAGRAAAMEEARALGARRGLALPYGGDYPTP